MMQSPWDRAQPDEWLPRNLRLCWGSSGGGYGGDSGGPGMGSGDGGGWGGWGGDSGFGGSSTGGGDWGSAGSYDASGFNAATNDAYGAALAASPGGYFDTGGAGIAQGALGAEFGGSFGTTGISGQPGTNAFGAELDAGGGGTSGVGHAIASWGQSTVAGPPGAGTFADLSGIPGGAPSYFGGWGDGFGGGAYGGGGYGGGGFTGGGGKSGSGGGYTGGGGGGGKSGGVTNSTPGYVGTASGGKDVTQSSPSNAPTKGEAQIESAGPDVNTGRADADPEAAPGAAPAPDADPDAAPLGSPAPSQSDQPAPAPAASRPSETAPTQTEAAPTQTETSTPTTSNFGPQSLNTTTPDYQGAPYTSNYDQGPQQAAPQASFDSRFGDWGAAPTSPAYQDAVQQLSNLTQTGLEPVSGMDLAGDRGTTFTFGNDWTTAPSSQAIFQAPAQSPYEMQGPPAPTFNDQINQVINDALRAGVEAPVSSITNAVSNLWGSSPLNPNSWVDVQSPVGMPGHQAYSGPFGGPDVVGDRSARDTFDSRFGFETGVNPGAEQYGTEAYTPGGINPGAEQTGVETGINPGAEQTGVEPAAPSIETFISGDREATDWNYGPQADLMNTPFMDAIDPSQTTQITPPSPLTQEEMNRAIDVDIRPAIDPSNAGRLQDAGEPQPTEASPATPGSQPTYDTTMESGPPGAPTTTDTVATPGSDPALSGAPVAPPALPPAQVAPQVPPSLVEMAQSGGQVTPQVQPTETPQVQPTETPQVQPGLVNMLPPAVPMPQARPSEAPQAQPAPAAPKPGDQDDAPENEPQQDPNTSRPPAPVITPREPGSVTAADRAARGPNAQPEPQHVQDARQYLLGTANPGDTMNRQGPEVAIARLEPNFAVRLAAAVREARANGLPNASVFSAFRAPNMGANPGYAAVSQHGRGVAVDMSGIGRPGSREAQLWYDIATRNGLFNPYGPNHRVEWNHYQAIQETGRQTANRLGPNPRNPPDNMVPTWDRVGVRPVVPPTQQTGVPTPRARPSDAPLAEPDVARPPADIPPPAARPPAEAPLETRPPADIPSLVPPRATGPNEFDIPVTPALRGHLDPVMIARTIEAIQKEALRGINPNTTKEQAMAQGAKGRAALIAAGVPPAMARAAMQDTGAKTAVLMGYGPGGPNSTVLGFPIPQSKIQSSITEGVGEAMQGYNPAASGGVIGKTNAFGGPVQGPPSPAPGKQGSLLDILQNFNPISTAEARGGRSQAGNLQAPRADPGTIQSRLSEQRSNVINDLQTNQGLRNTLDLIVTGEVGSQGKAAVLGFLETAMNKVAAEASREGRTATGRDLLQYLNNRSYFPDTWGKIESGKVKGGALTDDLLSAIAGGSNITGLSTGNSSAKGQGSRFGGNPTNATIGKEHYGVENYGHHAAWYNAMGALPAGGGIGSDFAAWPSDQTPAVAAQPPQEAPPRGGAQFFMPRDDDRAGSFPQGYFGEKSASGTPYPGTLYMEMARQTEQAQNNYLIGQMLHFNPEALANFIANQRASTNIDDRRGEIQPDIYGPDPDMPAVVAPPADPSSPLAQALGYGALRGLAKGGHVAKDEPVVVGEEGPEFFVPDQSGTVVPHMPQPGKGGKIDRWPKIPAPEYPGRFGGVEREILRQTRDAQDPSPGLMDMIDSGRLRLNEANWNRMLNDPSLIALGRSRMDDRREGIDPGAEQYGAFMPEPGPAAEPPDPNSPMAQALGYGSIKRRPVRVGRQSY